MIRSLYLKIFLCFCLVSIVVRTIVVLAGAVHYQSFEPLWMTGALNSYARSAMDAYRDGGKPGLARYLDNIEQTSRIRATLVDPGSQDILERGVPFAAEDVLREAQSLGHSRFRLGSRWRGASVIPTERGSYILVAEILPPAHDNLRAGLVRWSALLIGGVLCLFLTQHITAPIRSLQSVATRIADGDLSVRAMPAISPRRDELADLARDFDRMADRIQSLLEKQQELLAHISHELRSPLTRLGVCLELLRRGESDAVDRMQNDLACVNDLIQRILTLTRLQTNGQMHSEVPVNLRSIVENVAEDACFEGQGQEKSVIVLASDDCWIKGDPGLLRSCIENVVRNAVHYTDPHTTVEVRLLADGDGEGRSVYVLVADEGNGVPPEALPRLFEPFYRVSGARERNTGGSGLGLSIAQKIVLLHGGSIIARNRDQRGLEMEIRLPRGAPTNLAPAPGQAVAC